MAKKLTQYRGTGRRKNAIAAVILRPGSGKRTVNGKEFSEYFLSPAQGMNAELPFATLENGEEWDVIVNAKGGGIAGQVGAIRLGISRALVSANEEDRKALRSADLLTRDPRCVERKKYGKKKARRSPQFSKR